MLLNLVLILEGLDLLLLLKLHFLRLPAFKSQMIGNLEVLKVSNIPESKFNLLLLSYVLRLLISSHSDAIKWDGAFLLVVLKLHEIFGQYGPKFG